MPDNVLYITEIHQFAFGVNMVTTINHFHAIDGQNTIAGDINLHVVEEVLPAINALQGDFVTNDRVYTYFAGGTPDAYLRFPTGGGLRVSSPADIQPLFLTATVRWQIDHEDQYGPRVTPIENSYTRISGILDEDVYNGRLSEDMETLLFATFAPAWLMPAFVGGENYDTVCHVNKTKSALGWKIARQTAYMYSKLGTQRTRMS